MAHMITQNSSPSQQIQHHQKSREIVAEKECLNAPPLDFSFKNVENLDEFKQTLPRSGKRKDIKIDLEENKDAGKKNESMQSKYICNIEEESKKNTERVRSTSQNDQSGEVQPLIENEEVEKEEKEEKQDKEKDKKEIKKKDDVKKSPDQLIPQANVAANIILQHNISLYSGSGKVVGGKHQENKHYQHQQCVKINRVCVSLLLCQNKLRTLVNFYPVFDQIMFDIRRLQWIDLSYNYLEKLDYNFADFPQLCTLYLHCNFIWNIDDITQLQVINNLKSLTLYGNPIEQIPNIRFFVIGKLKTLKRIDSVLVGKKEQDNAEFFTKQFKFQPAPLKYIRKPPEHKIIQTQSQNEAAKTQL